MVKKWPLLVDLGKQSGVFFDPVTLKRFIIFLSVEPFSQKSKPMQHAFCRANEILGSLWSKKDPTLELTQVFSLYYSKVNGVLL